MQATTRLVTRRGPACRSASWPSPWPASRRPGPGPGRGGVAAGAGAAFALLVERNDPTAGLGGRVEASPRGLTDVRRPGRAFRGRYLARPRAGERPGPAWPAPARLAFDVFRVVPFAEAGADVSAPARRPGPGGRVAGLRAAGYLLDRRWSAAAVACFRTCPSRWRAARVPSGAALVRLRRRF